MGSVWLAERSDGLIRRKVALKLPHVARETAGLAQRDATGFCSSRVTSPEAASGGSTARSSTRLTRDSIRIWNACSVRKANEASHDARNEVKRWDGH